MSHTFPPRTTMRGQEGACDSGDDATMRKGAGTGHGWGVRGISCFQRLRKVKLGRWGLVRGGTSALGRACTPVGGSRNAGRPCFDF